MLKDSVKELRKDDEDADKFCEIIEIAGKANTPGGSFAPVASGSKPGRPGSKALSLILA